MNETKRLWLLMALGLVLVVFAPPVAAQEAEDPAEAEENEIPEAGENLAVDELIALAREPFGGEVVVTARRREEALQKFPSRSR